MISRYNFKPIAEIWSDADRYKIWLQIELAFFNQLRGHSLEAPSHFLDDWITKIQERENVSKHDVAAFVEWMEEDYLFPIVKEEARYVHYGLTSSDILDTAFVIQIRKSNKIIDMLVSNIDALLHDLRADYKDVAILGRTHGQAAELLSLAEKFHAWQKALVYNCPDEDERIYRGRLAGSVGDHKYFDSEIEWKVLSSLGLEPANLIDGQIIHRSVFADYMNEWAMLASVVEKIATDIRLLAQSEIAEIREGFSKGQMGSSSMPHKENPILSENLCGLARTIRGYQTTAMQNIALWNERDISHSSAERMIFPDATTLLGFMLYRLQGLLSCLAIDTERMGENIERFGTGIDSQEIMLTLIDVGRTRKEAHAFLRMQSGKE